VIGLGIEKVIGKWLWPLSMSRARLRFEEWGDGAVLQRQPYGGVGAELKAGDFVWTPGRVAFPDRITAEIARPSAQGVEALSMAPEASEYCRGWNARYRIQTSTDQTNIVSGWLKGQHPVIEYDSRNDPSSPQFMARLFNPMCDVAEPLKS
jgi:hypothetical protein